MRSDLPLFWDTTASPSAFTAVDWLKHRTDVLGQEPPRIGNAILTSLDALFEEAVTRSASKTSDFTGASHPFVEITVDARSVAVMHTSKGSYATGALEELIALGATNVLYVGSAGSVVRSVSPGDLLVPSEALRDEGVSYHYLPPSRYVAPSETVIRAVVDACEEKEVTYHHGRVWTIAAHFRESLDRIATYSAEGCLGVDNESASLFAGGQFRRAQVASVLAIGDSIASGAFVPGVLPDRSLLLDVAMASLANIGGGEG